ncbi:MAG: DUF2851 family protein [Flavobacteriales bacterium]|nr:DUF2851 family protein [Flavobacteriales bacterium]
MNEELLHYIWKFQLFNHQDLKLTSGESFQVIRSGIHNTDSGPDFFNGQVKIDSTKWAGNIEIHTLSSHWFQHKHQEDETYDRIILHVVWEDDKPVLQANGNLVPTIELKGLVNKTILEKFEVLHKTKAWIPCENYIHTIDRLVKIQAIDRNLISRLEQKSSRIDQILKLTKNDWEATLYQLLAKSFGFKVNSVPFELLAASIDFSKVRKLQQNEEQLSSLFFGQAGFLEQEWKGSYPISLQEQYQFLKNKYQLEALNVSIWKFMRMRPSNFPSIRIAQFVALFHQNKNLFQAVLESEKLTDLKKLFEVEANHYWKSHYRFDVPASKNAIKKLGEASIHILLINSVIPLLFNYGKRIGNEVLVERAVQLLQGLPPERNAITKKWRELDVIAQSAYDSQALIELKNNQCSNKKCLTCAVGSSILKTSRE